ncbi:ABC transporter ATP-binding protein [Clostridium formicaceticum]|uniref:ABC transporter ATP-binding protein n=1 Tax=Clostridium formicaceticum TaxID=1497 RepID=A0AAC9RNK9_9CLOT|nr:ABC transporter ATP-binding protein [Clostridium formicaceticum]AOY74501.1 ABC transporter ATP-binding protein [Clostridium formicaceticum]ARE88852.1 Putative multidrug export ATP-binding/permease protein [Clostridium formicaceticum]
MKKFFYNISSGNPKALVMPCFASFLEGICKIVPAALIFDVINTLYFSFTNPEIPLNIERLWRVCGMLIGWMVVQYLISGFAYSKTFTAAYDASANGRAALAEHLRKLSLGFLGSRDPGDLTTMMLGDYATVETTISHYVPQLVSATAFPIIAFIALLFINWQMAIAMFIALPFSILIVWLSTGLQLRLGKNHVKAKVDSASRLQEYLFGMREIKSHNLSGERFQRLQEAFARLMRESIRLEGMIGPVMVVAIALMRAGLTLMIFTGTFLLVGGQLTLPVFLVFLLLGTRVFEPLTMVFINYAEIRYSVLSAERIMQIRHEKPLSGEKNPPEGNSIEFQDVTFAYDNTDVLKNVSFSIPPKSITALVGPSGSGKSTITRLIARFWNVQEGRVLIDGEDIKEVDPEKLLTRISMVFQDVYLFKDTIRNNISVGKINASQQEIEWAAKQACCHDFIMKLPQGYDTSVGEGGCTLSGGEKQRISIARALLKDAPIVLLDEATASLDPENETQVQQAINALVKNKTVIIIAHRLKTIKGADKIIVLEKGKILEEGTHEALLEKQGLYHHLWRIQQQASGWRVQAL